MAAKFKSLGWVNEVGLIAAAVIVVRTVLLAVPEPWPWFREVGDVIYDVAIAIVTAWFFNWLVIERPLRQNRQRLYRTTGSMVAELTNGANNIGWTLQKHVWCLNTPGFERTGVFVVDLCDYKVDMNEAEWAEVLAPLSGTDALLPAGQGTIRDEIADWARKQDARQNELQSALRYFPGELVALLESMRNSRLRNWPDNPGAWADAVGRLESWAFYFAEYTDRCGAVRDYYRENIETHVVGPGR